MNVKTKTGYVIVSLALAGMMVAGCVGDESSSSDDDGGSGGGSSSGDATTGNSGASSASSMSSMSSASSMTDTSSSANSTSTGMALCDNTQCDDFCFGAGSCLFPDDTIDHQDCLAACGELCGNGFFDDTDAALMNCIGGISALDCDGAAACCSDNFTSELCP